ncbi:MAG: hypothetical protein HW417_686 [Steroidobacteraceae bacterium]|jgi:hypothetical protein|nr:hypothetical protein [Steroidobacteraceae bacterium]
MKERNDESFDLEDEFLGESSAEPDGDLDKLIVVERRPKGQRRPVQQSAWSKVEDVLAERRLKRELSEYDPDEI